MGFILMFLAIGINGLTMSLFVCAFMLGILSIAFIFDEITEKEVIVNGRAKTNGRSKERTY